MWVGVDAETNFLHRVHSVPGNCLDLSEFDLDRQHTRLERASERFARFARARARSRGSLPSDGLEEAHLRLGRAFDPAESSSMIDGIWADSRAGFSVHQVLAGFAIGSRESGAEYPIRLKIHQYSVVGGSDSSDLQPSTFVIASLSKDIHRVLQKTTGSSMALIHSLHLAPVPGTARKGARHVKNVTASIQSTPRTRRAVIQARMVHLQGSGLQKTFGLALDLPTRSVFTRQKKAVAIPIPEKVPCYLGLSPGSPRHFALPARRLLDWKSR